MSLELTDFGPLAMAGFSIGIPVLMGLVMFCFVVPSKRNRHVSNGERRQNGVVGASVPKNGVTNGVPTRLHETHAIGGVFMPQTDVEEVPVVPPPVYENPIPAEEAVVEAVAPSATVIKKFDKKAQRKKDSAAAIEEVEVVEEPVAPSATVVKNLDKKAHRKKDPAAVVEEVEVVEEPVAPSATVVKNLDKKTQRKKDPAAVVEEVEVVEEPVALSAVVDKNLDKKAQRKKDPVAVVEKVKVMEEPAAPNVMVVKNLDKKTQRKQEKAAAAAAAEAAAAAAAEIEARERAEAEAIAAAEEEAAEAAAAEAAIAAVLAFEAQAAAAAASGVPGAVETEMVEEAALAEAAEENSTEEVQASAKKKRSRKSKGKTAASKSGSGGGPHLPDTGFENAPEICVDSSPAAQVLPSSNEDPIEHVAHTGAVEPALVTFDGLELTADVDAVIFESASSWEVVGFVKAGGVVIARDEAQDVDGYWMVPIHPTGVVDSNAFFAKQVEPAEVEHPGDEWAPEEKTEQAPALVDMVGENEDPIGEDILADHGLGEREPEEADEMESEYEAIARQLPQGPRVCILGGTAFKDPASEALVEALGRAFAERLADRVVVLTGGMPGVQKTFATALGGSFPSLIHLLPESHVSGFGVGKDVAAGATLAERMAIFGELGDVYISVEGGPGVASEAVAACNRGALVLPMISTGGASSGMFDFPADALQRPACATEKEWSCLLEKGDPEVAAIAVVEMITRHLEGEEAEEEDASKEEEEGEEEEEEEADEEESEEEEEAQEEEEDEEETKETPDVNEDESGQASNSRGGELEEEQAVETTVEVYVPQSYRGRAIGKDGAVVKMLKEKTGVTNIDTKTGFFQITGTEQAAKKCAEAFQELCDKGFMSIAYDGCKEEVIETKQSRVPDLIGPKGSVIKKIKNEFKVEIEIPESSKSRDEIVKILIVGSSQGVDQAKKTVLDLLEFNHSELTHPGSVHQLLEVEPHQVGTLIGKNGSEIRQIENKFLVKVHIMGDGDRKGAGSYIVGKTANVASAKAYIDRLFGIVEARRLRNSSRVGEKEAAS